MSPYAALGGFGVALCAAAVLVGGWGAGLGGGAALGAQLVALALLRPAMHGPQPAFMRRWLAGIGVRAFVLGAVLALAATQRDHLPLLETSLGFLGVLLPLLFLETRFLK